MAEAWIVTCDERRVGALTTGTLEAGAVLAGTTVADVDTLKDAGTAAAGAGVSVLVLDAASSPSEAAVRSTIAAVRLVRGDAVRIVLVVDAVHAARRVARGRRAERRGQGHRGCVE